MPVIPANLSVLISIDYAPDGLAWARIFDNPVLGWHVGDDASAAEPSPVIIGQLPPVAADTGAILSPQWATYHPSPGAVLVPDVLRASADDFFTWLATNNGAHRPLDARLGISVELYNAWNDWAQKNPALVYAG